VMVGTAGLLGRSWGATGCAIASLITYAVMAWLSHQASRRNIARLVQTRSIASKKAR
jgi:hypothetical protein